MSEVPTFTKEKDNSYENWSFLFGALAFIVTWIYAISSWGFLIGIALGIIPALIVGILVYYFWMVIFVLGIFAFLGWLFLVMILGR